MKCNQSQKMRGIGVVWLYRKDLPVKNFRLFQPARLLMLTCLSKCLLKVYWVHEHSNFIGQLFHRDQFS